MKLVLRIVLLYTWFAAIATCANLATQATLCWLYSGAYAIELSILAGTLAGLPIKYVLEKIYIFQFKSHNLKHDGKLFFQYSLLGIFTTAIFWGVEFAFQIIYGTNLMRYLGGAIGLTVGYAIKYQLDKRFIFTNESPKAT